MSELTLVQLISEQTIQNLLPVLRLRPTKLVHLVTSRTAPRSRFILDAAHAVGIRPSLDVIQLSSMPGIQECYNAVAATVESSNDGKVVINFTGGTKLMSIGAYAVARTHKIPSLYVDTQDSCFVDGATNPEMTEILDGDWSFTPIRSALRVDVLGIANGVSRITAGQKWEPLLPFASHLFQNVQEEEASWAAIHGDSGLFPKGREPRCPKDWLPFLNKPISLPREVARLAIETGLFRPGNTEQTVFLPDAMRPELEVLAASRVENYFSRYMAAVAPLQKALAFLTGGWWEIIVCDAAHRSGIFRDLRWSVHVGERNGPDTEEDVLGLDGVELLSINCKRGGAKARLLPLLEEMRARAATVGGSFNRKFLAVRYAPTGKVAANLWQRAKELGIQILTGDNIRDLQVFSRRQP